MSFINNLWIHIFSTEVGQDKFGNRYYTNKTSDYLGRRGRQVIYNGIVEATKIPPMWHAWLHYMIDKVPNAEDKFVWQQEYSPNMSDLHSATKLARKLKDTEKNAKYTKWTPS